jgi:hypothetical protein
MGYVEWGQLPENRDLIELVRERNTLWRTDPHHLIPFLFRKCRVRVLLVTDGGLDFGSTDFGLRTFVKILQDAPFYVAYDVTLAHRRNRSGDAMMDGDASITARITNFRFDNTSHFASDKFDEVWLFGIESGPGIDDTELRAISEFMDSGGGLFATGDHGALGKAMGAEIPRARSMRLWDSTSANADVDEVSMQERRRNDTNRLGHDPGSQFNDQSDDVPQPITPKLYRVGVGIWEAVFPHPILCGPHGTIKIMPDHPHEGECIEPTNLTQSVTFAGATFQEYPAGTGGNPNPVPEVISTSTVLAGTVSGGKDATDPHSFGGICAYDGHRASVGRVVTDATWHHFVNVNLVGELGAASPKDVGFLATAAGQAHLEDIKTYYRNLAVWLARPSLISCMNWRILWQSIFDGRVVEAVTTAYDVSFQRASLKLLWDIGKHARDVLGRATSVCQTRRLVIDLVHDFMEITLMEKIDPWWPGPPPEPDPFPWFGLEPILDAAVGGAIMALRDEFLDLEPDKLDEAERRLEDVARKGVEVAVRRTVENAREAAGRFTELIARSKGRNPSD